jgi:hypothetical protein
MAFINSLYRIRINHVNMSFLQSVLLVVLRVPPLPYHELLLDIRGEGPERGYPEQAKLK